MGMSDRRHGRRIPVFLGVVLPCAAFTLFLGVGRTAAQEAVFLVRHAERLDQSQDSALSAEGRERAARLARMLRDAQITAIYVSQYRRTVETAKPLGDLLGLPPQPVPADDPDTLLAKLRSLGPRARALVVSHSDRLPVLLKSLGLEQDLTIPADEYDDLFIVFPQDKTGARVLRLRY